MYKYPDLACYPTNEFDSVVLHSTNICLVGLNVSFSKVPAADKFFDWASYLAKEWDKTIFKRHSTSLRIWGSGGLHRCPVVSPFCTAVGIPWLACYNQNRLLHSCWSVVFLPKLLSSNSFYLVVFKFVLAFLPSVLCCFEPFSKLPAADKFSFCALSLAKE